MKMILLMQGFHNNLIGVDWYLGARDLKNVTGNDAGEAAEGNTSPASARSVDTAAAPLALFWPFLSKLLLTQDPTQILSRYSYLASLLMILITFDYSMSCPVQFWASLCVLQHSEFLTYRGTGWPFITSSSSEILGLCSPAYPGRSFAGDVPLQEQIHRDLPVWEALLNCRVCRSSPASA